MKVAKVVRLKRTWTLEEIQQRAGTLRYLWENDPKAKDKLDEEVMRICEGILNHDEKMLRYLQGIVNFFIQYHPIVDVDIESGTDEKK